MQKHGHDGKILWGSVLLPMMVKFAGPLARPIDDPDPGWGLLYWYRFRGAEAALGNQISNIARAVVNQKRPSHTLYVTATRKNTAQPLQEPQFPRTGVSQDPSPGYKRVRSTDTPNLGSDCYVDSAHGGTQKEAPKPKSPRPAECATYKCRVKSSVPERG